MSNHSKNINVAIGGDDGDGSDGPWWPPKPSTATRKVPLRTKGSFTVFFVDPKTHRIVTAESHLEYGLAAILAADPRVADLRDQPPAVEYRDDEGQFRRHTFDYLATCVDKRRIAFAVKPESKVSPSGIERILDLIRSQIGPGFADQYVLRTGRHITPLRVRNARFIVNAMHHRQEVHLASIRELARSFVGAVRIVDIANASGVGACALAAVACLIGDGELRLVGEQPITLQASVERNVVPTFH